MDVQLPLEIVQLIILYIPFTRLRLLCEEDDSLRNLIAPILYRNVSIGHFVDYPECGWDCTTSKFHNITILELDQLVSGNTDARIQHLKITQLSNDSIQYLRKIWQIITDSIELFLKIPIVDFEGEKFDMCMEVLPALNVRHMSITLYSEKKRFQINEFPPNITSLKIDVTKITNIPILPNSLKHLVLSCHESKNLVFEFPPHLELFSNYERLSNYEISFSDKLPQSLLKLETCDIYNLTIPDSLIELKVENTNALIRFPSGLKKLTLKSFDSVVGMIFPDNLEVLDLLCLWPSLSTLEDVIFPSLLKELNLSRNELKRLDNFILSDLIHLEILDLGNNRLVTLQDVVFPCLLRKLNLKFNKVESLDNVLFPDLTYLDISLHDEGEYMYDPPNIESGVIRSLSRVHFPKLECLKAYGQPVKDWSIASLPETLKRLELSLIEAPRTVKFPPFLKVLKIYFIDELAKYSDLQLPDTLEELCLERGMSSIFDWNLPQLRSMKIELLTGPIKVPESVVVLSLGYKDSSSRGTIELPANVEKLEIDYPLEEYPPTVTHLRIFDCDVKSFALPPNVEFVYVSYGELDGSLFTPPNSLNYFRGPFDEDLTRPSNWDIENEFYAEEGNEYEEYAGIDEHIWGRG